MTSDASNGRLLSVRVRKTLGPYGSRRFRLDADFSVSPGITILFGPSGAGKTTLLQCIAGLIHPDEGRIVAGERVLFDSAKKRNVPVAQRSVAYVFQTLALFPHLTVEQNIQYGLSRLNSSARHERTQAILESFHIEGLGPRRPDELSGGERQRVALARSLVTNPAVLLLDEPLGALDNIIKSKIISDLRAWNAAHRIPILYVTHSRVEVFALGERMIALKDGRILVEGTPQQVLESPRQETMAQLAGFENIFSAIITRTHEAHGTMTCRIENSDVELEVPLGRAEVGSSVRIAIRAGDILLATEFPRALSARNVLTGRLESLAEEGVTVIAFIDCGVTFKVHLTPGAREALGLQAGKKVWLIVKTYSCHLLEAEEEGVQELQIP